MLCEFKRGEGVKRGRSSTKAKVERRGSALGKFSAKIT